VTTPTAEHLVENETSSPASSDAYAAIPITRHRLDIVLTTFGALTTAVLLVAGGLLAWGASFAGEYVTDELAAQNITFPAADALSGQGRDDLVPYAEELVDTGEEAEAYASYIAGHIEGIAEGQTYAELGGPERAAEAAVNDAIASGATDEEVTELEEAAAAISEQRESIFRGEMLRGALLNTFAWDTVGTIAGLASWAAFISAGLMLVLTALGFVHLRRNGA
jgi:hypothetical protein